MCEKGDELTVLEWIYEKIISTGIDEYVENENLLKGKNRNDVCIEIFEQIADKARLMETYTSRKDQYYFF